MIRVAHAGAISSANCLGHHLDRHPLERINSLLEFLSDVKRFIICAGQIERPAEPMKNTFEKAIIEDPENSDLYAVYSDWLVERGDARGEFIQVQLRLEDKGISEQQRELLLKREAALLQQSQHLWAPAPADLCENGLVFKRGFLVGLHEFVFNDHDLAALMDFPHLQALSIMHYESEAGLAAALAQLPLLRELHLPEISDEVLLQVAKQAGLRSLSFSGPVTNAGLDHLRALPALEKLHYHYYPPVDSHSDPITDIGLKHLSHHRSLRSLVLGGSSLRIADNGFAHLKDLLTLEELSVAPSKLTAIGLAHLGGFISLTRLGLTHSVLANEDMHHLTRLSNLKRLNLEFSNLNDVGMHHVAAIAGLRFLGLERTQVTASGLATLAQCTSLESLQLPPVDSGLQHLKTLSNLKHLAFPGLRVPIESLAPLASLPDLQTLWLRYTGVTSAALADLSGLAALRSANLCGTPITDDGLATLRPLALEELNVSDTKVSDASLAMLCDMRSLRVLNVSSTAISDSGLATL